MPNTDCPSREKLFGCLVGTLAEDEADGVLEHVSSCIRCQEMLQTLNDADDTLMARLRCAGGEDRYANEPERQEMLGRIRVMAGVAAGPGSNLPDDSATAAVVLGQLGEYQLLEKLGQGGMGAVYKARQTNLGRVVALKVLPKERSENQVAIARFYREMRAVGGLSHPNIVQAFDAREIDGSPVLAMEYVEGLTLAKIVSATGALRVADACELVRQTAVGLQHAHEQGLVHRDIKPSNLMLASVERHHVAESLRDSLPVSESPAYVAAALADDVATTAIANGNFNNTNPIAASFGWRLRGETSLNQGTLVLGEHAKYLSSASQSFFVPAGATTLRFEIVGGLLHAADGLPVEAFQVSLLTAADQQPLFGVALLGIPSSAGSADSDAILTMQADGATGHHDRVTLSEISPEAPFGTPDTPITVEIDLSGVAAGTELLLYFDLLGFGPLDSQIVIDNVVVLRDSSSLPTANPDSATIDEDIPIALDVLANDTDSDGTLDRNSVSVVRSPQHGTFQVDVDTGVVEYQPVNGYAGSDTFTYTVSDNAGNTSTEATVSITVNPIADTPRLTAASAAGTVNSSILLDISSELRDPDGSETLTIRISGVPAGAFLSAGTQVQTGIYELTPAQLDGLAITPPIDSTETIVLQVSAIAEESLTKERKVSSATVSVLVTPVLADPVQIDRVIVNNGESQRSTIHTLAIQFNQDVSFFHGVEEDVTITSASGEAFPLTADDYFYDPATYTLTIDTSHVQLEDGHYNLVLSIDGVRGVADPGSRLKDIDADPNDGRLTLEYHQLVADFSGGDSVDRADYDSFLQHYPSRYGDARYDAIFDLNNDRRIDSVDYGIWRTAQGRTTDTKPPQIRIALQADTGGSASDNVTKDPTIIGLVSDTSPIGSLYVSVDGQPRVAALDQLAAQDSSSGIGPRFFQFTREELESYLGAPLWNGTHTITITAADVHYNTSLPIQFMFILCTRAPAAPSAPDLVPESDTGLSNSDDLTSDSLPTFRVAGAGGDAVTLYRDGQMMVRAATEAGQSLLSGVNLGFVTGILRFTATTTDLAGNESEPSPELVVTLDVSPPKRPTLGLDPAFDTNTLTGDTLGDRQTTYATVTLAGKTEPGATVVLVDTAYAPVVADAVTGEFQFPGVALNLGSNPFTVEARDAAGNTSRLATSIRRLGLELDPPEFQIFGLQTDSGPDPHDHVTNDATIVGLVYEQHELRVLKLGIDQEPNIDIRSWLDAAGQFVLTVERWIGITGHAPTNGAHTIYLYAEDEFVNTVNREFSFTMDNLPPASPISVALYADDWITHDTGPSDHDGITNRSIFTILADAEPGSIVRLFRTHDGQTIATERWAASDVESFNVGNWLEPLPDGIYDFQSEVVDVAGNTVRSVVYRVVVDTVVPLTPSLVFEGAGADGRTARDRVAVSGSTDPGVLVELYRVGWDSVPTPQPIAVLQSGPTGAFRFDEVMLSLGPNAFSLVARDWAGNTSTTPASVYSNADDISPPLVTAELLYDNGFSNTDRITNDATIAGTVDDASYITGLFVSVDGAAPYDWKARLADGRFVLSPSDLAVANGARLRDGEHRVQITAQDEKGLLSDVVTLDWTLDTIRPLRPSSPDLVSTDDSGVSRFDSVTNVRQQTFQLLAEPDTKVRLYANGDLVALEQLVHGPIELTSSFLLDGPYLITATAEDVAGNVSDFALPLRAMLDTTPPPIPTLTRQQSPEEAKLGANHTTRQRVDLNGTTEPGVRVELYRGSHGSDVGWLSGAVPSSGPDPLIDVVWADTSGHYTFPDVDLLLNGQQVQENPLTVESRDTAGNLSRSLVTLTTHDLDAPAISMSLADDTGAIDDDRLTNNPAVDVLIQDASALASLSLKLDDAEAWTEWPIDFRFTFDDYSALLPAGQTLTDGIHYLTVNAVDQFGQSSYGSIVFTLDRQAPKATAPRVVKTYDRGPRNNDGVTNVTAPWVTVDAQLGDYVQWYVDGKFLTGSVATELALLKVQLPQLLEDPHQVTVVITDTAGNTSPMSPVLDLVIDTTPITADQFTIDLADESDTQTKGDGHTTLARVNLTGLAEPGAVVSISENGILAEADGSGVFLLQDVPLVIGNNPFHLVVIDLAGNISEFDAAFVRDDKPQIALRLAHDTPIAGGTDSDGLTSDPTVLGQLFAPNPIVALLAGFDGTAQDAFLDVTGWISGNGFQFGPDRIVQINSAPLLTGTHTLHVVAYDSQGRWSDTATLTFEFDAGPQVQVTSQAEHQASTGRYTYHYTATNTADAPPPAPQAARLSVLDGDTPMGPALPAPAADPSWVLREFSVPVPAESTIGEIVVPDGWSATYTPGDTEVRWTADTQDAGLAPGESLEFGFASGLPQAKTAISIAATDPVTGEERTSTQTTVSPKPADGPAIYDRVQAPADTLTILQADQLLANDRLVGGPSIQLVSVDAVSAWGVPLTLRSDGTVAYDARSTRLSGVGQDESVTDSFRYTIDDGTGETFTGTVDVVILGDNQAPVAGDDWPVDPDTSVVIRELHVRINATASITFHVLLANDVDPDANDNPLEDLFEITATDKTLGQLTPNYETGQLVYNPKNAGFPALPYVDEFQYTVRDQHGAEDTALVKIKVYPTNHAPTASGATFNATENVALTGPSLAALASDSDSLPGRAGVAVLSGTVISTLGVTVDISPGGFTYHTESFAGFENLAVGSSRTDGFAYTVRDEEGATASGWITILVAGANDSPIAADDQDQGADEDNPFSGAGLLENDTDVDTVDSPDLKQVVVPAEPVVSQFGVTVSLYPSGDYIYDPTGVLDWLPENDGTHEGIDDSFTYTMTDNRGGYSTATVTVHVDGINDAPEAVNDGVSRGYATLAYMPVTISTEYGVLVNDKDVDQGETEQIRVNIETEPFEGVTALGGKYTLWKDGRFLYDPRESAQIQLSAQLGNDRIDSFTYSVVDPHGEVSVASATVSIVVKTSEPYYDFEVVASTSDGFKALGWGPSINNEGHIAFQGTLQNDRESIFIWDKDQGYRSLVSPGMTDGSDALLPPQGNPPDEIPAHRFGEAVQINDNDLVAAQRQMYANGIVGIMPMGLPLFEDTSFLLTYAEAWNGGAVLNEGKYELPKQLAVGDMGLSGAGLRWGNPLFIDMQIAALTALMPGLAGFAMSAEFTLIPRVWVLDPVWASLYFSPVDPAWLNELEPEEAANFETVAYNALKWYSENPFSYFWPNTLTINNSDEIQTAFAAHMGPQYDGVDELITTFHNLPNGITQLGVQTTDFQAAPKIADNGRIVFSTKGIQPDAPAGGEIYSFPYDLDPSQWVKVAGPDNGFTDVGAYPAISDDGSLMVFTAVHEELGPGIYIADPLTGNWSKVAGESADGILDGGEEHVDLDGNGQFNTSDEFGPEDFGPFTKIPLAAEGLDAHLAINNFDATRDWPFGKARYHIAFMAETTGPGGEPGRGLYTIEIQPESLCDESAQPLEHVDRDHFIAHRHVVRIGEIVPGIGEVKEVRMYDAMNEDGDLSLQITATDQSNGAAVFVVHAPYWTIDVDIDSDNDGEIDDENSLLGKDDPIESKDDEPGQLLIANLDDKDNDGIPDFADGYNRDGNTGNEDDRLTIGAFTPLFLEVPANVDLTTATFHLSYSASDPIAVTEAEDTLAPPDGHLRLWKRDAREPRNPNSPTSVDTGDYLAPGTYSASQIGFKEGDNRITLFIEAIRPGSEMGDQHISIAVDPDGHGPALPGHQDEVQLTAVQLHVGLLPSEEEGLFVSADDAQVPICLMITASLLDKNGEPTFFPVVDGTVVSWNLIEGATGSLSAHQATTTDGVVTVNLSTSRRSGDAYPVRAQITKLIYWPPGYDDVIEITESDTPFASRTETFTVVAGEPAIISYSLSKPFSVADGTGTMALAVWARDAHGNLVREGTPVTWVGHNADAVLSSHLIAQADRQTSDGLARAILVAPEFPFDQEFSVIVGGTSKTIVVPVHPVSGLIRSDRDTADAYAGQFFTLTMQVNVMRSIRLYSAG